MNHYDFNKKIRDKEYPENVRQAFADGSVEVYWYFTLKYDFSKNKFVKFKEPTPFVFELGSNRDIFNFFQIEVGKKGKLSSNFRRATDDSDFFETEEECYSVFKEKLAKIKVKALVGIEKTLKKFEEGELIALHKEAESL